MEEQKQNKLKIYDNSLKKIAVLHALHTDSMSRSVTLLLVLLYLDNFFPFLKKKKQLYLQSVLVAESWISEIAVTCGISQRQVI